MVPYGKNGDFIREVREIRIWCGRTLSLTLYPYWQRGKAFCKNKTEKLLSVFVLIMTHRD